MTMDIFEQIIDKLTHCSFDVSNAVSFYFDFCRNFEPEGKLTEIIIGIRRI